MSPADVKTRPLYIITTLGTGGAERMLVKLLAELDRSRFSPAVISLASRGTYGAQLEDLGIEVRALGMRGGIAGLAAAACDLTATVRDLEPDLIHGWMYHGNVAASLAAPFARGWPPVLWNVRGSLDDLRDFKPATRWVIRAGVPLSRAATAIVYCSRIGLQQHGAFGYDRARQTLIPNGFDTERLAPDAEARASVRAELKVCPGNVVIGHVARWHEAKDHATFLKAASLVTRQAPYCRFAMAGTGVTAENSTLLGLVRESGIQDRIRLLGERQDVPRLLSAFDVFCLSSAHSEGFPNVLGEAMACGVPCVTTASGDSGWIVGDTGQVVRPRDPAALAAALVAMAESGSAGRALLGAAARTRIQTEFSLRFVTERYEGLYSAVLGL